MKTIADLLRSADPLATEPIWSSLERAAVRRAVVEKSLGDMPLSLRSRRPLLVALATAGLVILAGVTIVPRLWSPAVEAAVRFEVRLAEEVPGPGLEQVEIPASGRKIYLHREAIVENGDIQAARVVPGNSPQTFGVDVTFSRSGAEKVSRATGGHIGKPVAILIDGKFVAAPTLRSTLTTSAVISGDFTRAEADRIASGMIGR